MPRQTVRGNEATGDRRGGQGGCAIRSDLTAPAFSGAAVPRKGVSHRSVWDGGVTGRSNRTVGAISETHLGSEITQEAVEFGKVMVRLRQLLGRTPNAVECLRAARAMGYKRPPAPVPGSGQK